LAQAAAFAALAPQERTLQRYNLFPNVRAVISVDERAGANALLAQTITSVALKGEEYGLEDYEAIARWVPSFSDDDDYMQALSALAVAFVALPPQERTPERFNNLKNLALNITRVSSRFRALTALCMALEALPHLRPGSLIEWASRS
jgi:hypothetical protein